MIAIVVLIAGAWAVNYFDLFEPSTAKPVDSALLNAGEKCAGIAENAVSKIVAVVAFQKLEIIGRKARVMRNCMADNGYVESSAWVSYATPLAQKAVVADKISFNEALENLKRIAMYRFSQNESNADEKAPVFWQKVAKNPTEANVK